MSFLPKAQEQSVAVVEFVRPPIGRKLEMVLPIDLVGSAHLQFDGQEVSVCPEVVQDDVGDNDLETINGLHARVCTCNSDGSIFNACLPGGGASACMLASCPSPKVVELRL